MFFFEILNFINPFNLFNHLLKSLKKTFQNQYAQNLLHRFHLFNNRSNIVRRHFAFNTILVRLL